MEKNHQAGTCHFFSPICWMNKLKTGLATRDLVHRFESDREDMWKV